MMPRLSRLLAACLWLLLPAFALQPEQVVVVYNADSALSFRSAERYAQARRIPTANMVGLSGVRGGHISRADFEQKVRLPLLEEGHRKGWRWPSGYTQGSTRRILAMVLMPDLPLGVLATPRPKDAPALPWQETDAAAMDSELMTLGGKVPAKGMCGNPCYGKDITLGMDFPPVMVVCRIDGPDEATINRMIDDPIKVERQGLWGWAVVDHGAPNKEGEAWMEKIAQQAEAAGHALFHETSRATLAPSFPLMWDTAVYFGWYTHPADGPFRPEAAGGFRFAPGAIAVHLHSNSASSIKDAHFWAPALLRRGAAVSAGNVFEPYLGPSLHLHVFFDRLMKGSSVAEAALMASPVVSWQSIILGDPFYRPFAAATRGKVRADNVYAEWKRIRTQAGNDLPKLRAAVTAQEQKPWGAQLAEVFAWYCLEHKFFDYAYEYFASACGRYKALHDRTRTAIMAASALAADGNKSRAERVLMPWLEAGESSPYLPALRKSYEAITGKKLPEEPKKK